MCAHAQARVLCEGYGRLAATVNMDVALYEPATSIVAPTDEDRSRANTRASMIFFHIALFACFCLQRFCLYIGDSPVYFALPIFLALLGWLLATGRAAVSATVMPLFGLVVVVGIASLLFALNLYDRRIGTISPISLFALLVIYVGLTVRPTARFDTRRGFDVFIFYIRLCAIAGIAQYLAQFAGIRLFSFMLAVPALKPILAEPLFNYQPIVAYGSSILRSNGFFLVEPSVFSQLLMLGIIVDVFVRREWRYLPLYGVAYLFTYAGTGALSLGVAALLFLLVAPARSPRILLFALLALMLAGVGAVAFPDQFGQLAGRSDELSYSGSSGYARYMNQFVIVGAISNETRTLIGFGPGALERATFFAEGGTSAALKLYVDYGILGLISFSAFLVGALWRREIAFVSIFVLVNFQLGGGYLLFAPMLVIGAILCIWTAPHRRPG